MLAFWVLPTIGMAVCYICPGQNYAFRGSTGVPRQYLGAPDWLEQRYHGVGKYEPLKGDLQRTWQLRRERDCSRLGRAHALLQLDLCASE